MPAFIETGTIGMLGEKVLAARLWSAQLLFPTTGRHSRLPLSAPTLAKRLKPLVSAAIPLSTDLALCQSLMKPLKMPDG